MLIYAYVMHLQSWVARLAFVFFPVIGLQRSALVPMVTVGLGAALGAECDYLAVWGGAPPSNSCSPRSRDPGVMSFRPRLSPNHSGCLWRYAGVL